MSEAQETANQTHDVVFGRSENNRLTIIISAPTTGEAMFEKYVNYVKDAGLSPVEIAFDLPSNTMDIGTSELFLVLDEYPGFDIVATEIASPDEVVEAIKREIALDTSKTDLSSENKKDVKKPAEVNEPPHTQNTAVATPIQNSNRGTKIKSNAGPTKISKAAPSPIASSRAVERLMHEGIGSRAKHQKQKPRRDQHTFGATRREEYVLREVNHTTRGKELLANALSNVQKPGVDGVDFINTSAMAETELGSMLDINAHVRFSIMDGGSFASVGAFWYFVASEDPDDSIRNLHGSACRNMRYRLVSREVEGFNYLIAEATWAKVCQNDKLRHLMCENELEYRCFFIQEGGLYPQKSKLEFWYMPILEEIGNTLKRIKKSGNQELVPDFSFLDRNADPAPRQNRRY